MITMIGAIATFERELILERQREGIALAKAAGKYKGRKKILPPSNFKDLYALYLNRQIRTKKRICKKMQSKPSGIGTLYKRNEFKLQLKTIIVYYFLLFYVVF